MPSLTVSEISRSAFDSILARYPATVPAELQELDTLRYETIPRLPGLHEPRGVKKEHIEKLVEWKLKHGHFRPNLLKLVKSNTEKEIEDITAFAYQELQNPVADNYMGGNTAIDSVTVTLHILQKLKGIGTATGSLILSVWTPMPYESIEDDCMDEYEREISGVPFFSDELFRWCMWDAGSKGKELGGWQRKIRYTGKEWKDMREQVWKLGKRLGVKAVECEKVAYVLGRERVDVGMEFREGQGEDLSIDPKRSTSTDTKKQSVTEDETRAGATENKIPKTDSKAGVSLKKVGKRKITDTISPPEVVRKSSRRKTSN